MSESSIFEDQCIIDAVTVTVTVVIIIVVVHCIVGSRYVTARAEIFWIAAARRHRQSVSAKMLPILFLVRIIVPFVSFIQVLLWILFTVSSRRLSLHVRIHFPFVLWMSLVVVIIAHRNTRNVSKFVHLFPKPRTTVPVSVVDYIVPVTSCRLHISQTRQRQKRKATHPHIVRKNGC